MRLSRAAALRTARNALAESDGDAITSVAATPAMKRVLMVHQPVTRPLGRISGTA